MEDTGNYKLDYDRLKSNLDEFANELTKQLSKLFKEEFVNLGFPIQARVKKWESTYYKIKNSNLRLKKLLDIQDLVGLRVILLFLRDIDKVRNIINKSFYVIREYNTKNRLKEDQFGYSSIHFVIGVPESWLSVPTLKNFKDLKAEIQIRTVSQHIWAEASHDLQYKNENNIPYDLKRNINRISALLETVDLEFERMLHQRDEYRKNLGSKVIDKLDERLNVDLLEKIADEKFPENRKTGDLNYSSLMDDLNSFNIDSSKQLIDLLDKHYDKVLEFEKEQIKEVKAFKNVQIERGNKDVNLYHLLKGLVEEGPFFNQIGLIREFLRVEFGKEWERYIKKKREREWF